MDKLDRAQDLLSRQGRSEASYTEVLDQLLDFYFERKDPLKKVRKNKVSQYNIASQSKLPLKNVGKKTNLEEDLQNRVLAKANPAYLLQKKSSHEMSLQKLRQGPLNEKCNKARLKSSLQKQALQKKSLKKMAHQETGEDIPKKAGAMKTIPAKTRSRRAIPQKIKTRCFRSI